MTTAGVTTVPKVKLSLSYPRKVTLNGRTYTIRRVTEGDRDAIVAFARALPEENLLFLRIDLTSAAVVDDVIATQETGNRVNLVAEHEGRLVGYCGLNRDALSWTRHLGEIRVIVDSTERGQGLGSLLARELFSAARDMQLSKVVARMTREQEGARRLFERLGFTAEALLTDWVMDRSGKTRDLVMMSHDVTSLTN